MKKVKQIGSIKELFISSKDDKKRYSKNSIIVDKDGILEDKFYNKSLDRSILITSMLAYEKMQDENISANFGELGENIIVDFNPHSLEEGTTLYIDDVILEITQKCTICEGLQKIDSIVPSLLKDDRGTFAKVIQPGTMSTNSSINIKF